MGLFRRAKKIEDIINDWHKKGIQQQGAKNYERALECYNNALELDPNLASSWSNKAQLLSTIERYEDAIICYKKAIELCRTITPANLMEWKAAYSNGTERYWENTEYEAWFGMADAIYQQATTKDTTHSMWDSIECLDHVIEFTERKYEDTLQQCHHMHDRFQYGLLTKFFEKMKPADFFQIERLVDALFSKGRVLQSLGRDKEARVCFERADVIIPFYTIENRRTNRGIGILGGDPTEWSVSTIGELKKDF